MGQGNTTGSFGGNPNYHYNGNSAGHSARCQYAQQYANGKCETSSDTQFGGMTGATESMVNGLACLAAQSSANKICRNE